MANLFYKYLYNNLVKLFTKLKANMDLPYNSVIYIKQNFNKYLSTK